MLQKNYIKSLLNTPDKAWQNKTRSSEMDESLNTTERENEIRGKTEVA